MKLALFLSLVLLFAIPSLVPGQVLEGTVRDASNEEPVPSVFVQLLDPADRPVAASMTDSLGTFSVRAPASGHYRLSLQALGYRSETPQPLMISGTVTRTFLLTPSPLAIPGLVVRGSPRCLLRPETAAETASIWERVREAIQSAAYLNREEVLRYRVARFRRRLDPDSTTIWEESLTLSELPEPFHTLSPDSLLQGGFVRREGDTLVHFMPDLSVLLSRTFMDAHCFDLVENGSRSSVTGLRFEPYVEEGREEEKGRRRGLRGVFRIDGETGAPLALAYGYPTKEDEETWARGRAEFQEILDGLWVIDSWTISMPRFREGRRLFGLLRDTEVVEIVEEGGRVLEVRTRGGLPLTEEDEEELTGLVVDSIHGGSPLAGAVVRLSGLSASDTTGAGGRFHLAGLPAGAQLVTLSHPLLDTLGVGEPARAVSLPVDRPVRLAVPSRETVFRLTCPGLPTASRFGVLWGTVSVPGAPVGGLPMELRYIPLRGREGSTEITTDEEGFYRVCGVPPGEITIEVPLPDRPITRTLVMPEKGIVRVDIRGAG